MYPPPITIEVQEWNNFQAKVYSTFCFPIFTQLIYSIKLIDKTDLAMELRQLRYFLNAAETQNFTEAAKVSCITQSTLSQQIKQLENELNVLLFDRIGKRLYITEAGKEFVPFARQTLHEADLGKQRILDLQNIRTGSLRIGITHSLSFGLSYTVLRFVQEYPNIHLEIISSTITDLLQMLKRREIDFVLSFNNQDDDEIDVTDLFEVPLCAIMNKRHPLADKKQISLFDLKTQPLVLPSKGLNARTSLDKLLTENHFTLDSPLEMYDVNIILHLIESSFYITILSKAATIGRDKIIAIPLAEQKQPMVASLLTLRGAYQKKSAKAFLDFFNDKTELTNNSL